MQASPGDANAATSLLSLVHNDLHGAFKVLCGLFLIGVTFTAVTLPPSYLLIVQSPAPISLFGWKVGDLEETTHEEGRKMRGECSSMITVYVHWCLLFGFVFVQSVQLPFRLRAFFDIVQVGYDLSSRDEPSNSHNSAQAIEYLKAAMNGFAWKTNQLLGFTGQYLIPTLGLIQMYWFGDGVDENPSENACFASAHREKRPSSFWYWLGICVVVRVILTFLWGYYTTEPHLQSNYRGANQALLDTLEQFTYAEAESHHLTRCAICISDFEDGDTITRLPCDTKHIYHKSCVFQWLKRCKVCPLCMQQIDVKGKRN